MPTSRSQEKARRPRRDITRGDTPDPEHLNWVIHGRARNQIAALNIYALMKDHRDEIRVEKLSYDLQTLAAVAFSLWRAVFLADRTGAVEAKMADAELFLGKMLTDNAIAFAQDRGSREWTFNYYVDNARFRLQQFKDSWSSFSSVDLLPPPGRRTPKRRWDYLQEALDKAIDLVSDEVKNSN